MTTTHTCDELISFAHETARMHSLTPELVCAVIEQESSWDRWAMRYEPRFYSRYIAPQVTRGTICSETEARARAFSWGLMQVMGQVAREHGFTARSLATLCEADIGIEIGCRVLATKFAAADGNSERALLLWNGGANPHYAKAVLARCGRYQAK